MPEKPESDVGAIDMPHITAVAGYIFHNSDGQIKQLAELVAALALKCIDLEEEIEKLEMLPENVKRIEKGLNDASTWQ